MPMNRLRLIIALVAPMALCSCSNGFRIGADETRMLGLLRELPIGSSPKDLERLLPESSREKPEPGSNVGTEKTISADLFGQQMEGEFNYQDGKLNNHGFRTRSLDRDTGMGIYKAVRDHLARQWGKPKESQGQGEDSPPGYYWNAEWKLEGAGVGVYCVHTYDGYQVGWGAGRRTGTDDAPAAEAADGAPGELTVRRYEHGNALVETIEWRNESAITVTVDKRVVFRRAFFSDSGHNGYYIMDGAWSPDGACFAFKLASAGGHMPYRSPVKILQVRTRPPVLIDAETIIRRIPGISNVAVSHYKKPYIKWMSDTQLQVNVMSHNEKTDAGMYVIDLATLTARKQSQPDEPPPPP